MFIYLLKNTVSGNTYIGQTKDIHKRWVSHMYGLKSHKYDMNSGLQKDYDLYGQDSFEMIEIEECPKEIANERERYWIKYYKSLGNCHNVSPGGIGVLYEDEYYYEYERAIVKKFKNTELYENIANGNIALPGKKYGKRKVICLNNCLIFNSCTEAANYAGISPQTMCDNLKHRQHTAGEHPVTGEKLVFRYYCDGILDDLDVKVHKKKYKKHRKNR